MHLVVVCIAKSWLEVLFFFLTRAQSKFAQVARPVSLL